MSDDDLADVIQLPSAGLHAQNSWEADLDANPVRRKRKIWPDRACAHKTAQVDLESRILVCKQCGVGLDPFDVLAQIADKGEDIVRRRHALRADIKTLEARLERLTRDEVNAKSRIRSAKRRAGL